MFLIVSYDRAQQAQEWTDVEHLLLLLSNTFFPYSPI